jgi:hypothetical protein
MALIDMQTALGRLVRAPACDRGWDDLGLDVRERAYVAGANADRGLRFTRDVQRSWCRDRARKAAELTFSVLSPSVGRVLLDEWVDLGGGTSSFVAFEADALLEFIAARLPDPSHPLAVCRLEQAVLRANAGRRSLDAAPPTAQLIDPYRRAQRGRHAALLTFYGRPAAVIAARGGAMRLPLSAPVQYAVAPGITSLCRPASSQERALWSRLASPAHVAALTRFDRDRATLATMLAHGLLELVPI